MQSHTSVILASPPYAQKQLPGTMMILPWTSHVFNLKANELPVFGNIIYPLVADYVLLGAENYAYYLVEDTGKRNNLWGFLEDGPVGLQESVIYIVSPVLFSLLWGLSADKTVAAQDRAIHRLRAKITTVLWCRLLGTRAKGNRATAGETDLVCAVQPRGSHWIFCVCDDTAPNSTVDTMILCDQCVNA
jgi:hypothetical protein